VENERFDTGGSWRIIASAALSIAVVIGILAWQFHTRVIQARRVGDASATSTSLETPRNSARELAEKLGLPDPTATSSTPEEIAQIGSNAFGQIATYYAILEQNNAYTPEIGAQIAASIAPSIHARVPYSMYDEKSLSTHGDTSYAGMRAYRTALQTSLAPLKLNKEYELHLYGAYMETRDVTYLTKLTAAAQHYREAAGLTARITVPKDATSIHIAVLNAMQKFASTLDLMVANISDPITSLALLSAYSKAEDDMVNAFTTLDDYYASKQP